MGSVARPNPGRPVLTSFLRSVRRVQRSVTEMPAALSGSEHSRTRKIPRRSKAMTHAGSRERMTWEVWQGGQGMTHLYTRAGLASCQFITLLPLQTTTWESIFSPLLDAPSIPPRGLLRLLQSLQGVSFSNSVWSLGGLPLPRGRPWTTKTCGCLRTRHGLSTVEGRGESIWCGDLEDVQIVHLEKWRSGENCEIQSGTLQQRAARS